MKLDIGDEPLEVAVHLDYHDGSGWLDVRDSASYRSVRMVLSILRKFGWHENGDDEAIQPHEFDDGEVGVRVILHRRGPATVANTWRAVEGLAA